ncbi:MAG: hypothetical protein IPK19_07145 [Chloroflexi bacterium]|nr:hypothetical protein [Chloroflexota bacterium]
MSEYQYYEFYALDQPLTSEAQAEMRRLSSRVQLTATSASFVYNYGDFRGNPFAVLADYFDAMLYITNWGTRQLMFRFPATLIPTHVMEDYQFADSIEWSSEGEYAILNIQLNEEAGGEWVDGTGMLSRIAPVRNDVLRGDYRALYLAWLMLAEYELGLLEDDEDLTEPPVPPDLHALTPALHGFLEFFEIDPDLVAAAAETSTKAEHTIEELAPLLDRLSGSEKQAFLVRLLSGEPHLDVILARRLRELSGARTDQTPLGERRTIRHIVAASKHVRKQRLEIEQQQREAAHLKKLELIGQHEAQLWAKIPGLIDQRRADTYDEAVSILSDLRSLAVHQQRTTEFHTRLGSFAVSIRPYVAFTPASRKQDSFRAMDSVNYESSP